MALLATGGLSSGALPARQNVDEAVGRHGGPPLSARLAPAKRRPLLGGEAGESEGVLPTEAGNGHAVVLPRRVGRFKGASLEAAAEEIGLRERRKQEQGQVGGRRSSSVLGDKLQGEGIHRDLPLAPHGHWELELQGEIAFSGRLLFLLVVSGAGNEFKNLKMSGCLTLVGCCKHVDVVLSTFLR